MWCNVFMMQVLAEPSSQMIIHPKRKDNEKLHTCYLLVLWLISS